MSRLISFAIRFARAARVRSLLAQETATWRSYGGQLTSWEVHLSELFTWNE